MQVQANQTAIETDTAQLSNLVDQRQMQSLPLITRNPYQLVLLSPGTSQTDSGNAGISVNGARDRNNNFMLDGVDNNDTSVPGGMGGVLSANPDSTEEFRVITDNFNAEYGRNTGAIIDVITEKRYQFLPRRCLLFRTLEWFRRRARLLQSWRRTERRPGKSLHSSSVRFFDWRPHL